MISSIQRATLLSLGLVLATAFAVRSAQAGTPFWTGPNCYWPTDVPGSFSGSFFGNAKCEAVCKAAASACRSSVKEAVSCQKGEYAAYWKAYALYYCAALTDAEKTACLMDLKASKTSFKSDLSTAKAGALADCKAFLGSCTMGCTTPPAL